MKTLMGIKLVILLNMCVDLCLSDWASIGQAHSFVCQTAKRNVSSIVWQYNDRSLFQCQNNAMFNCDPAYDNLLEIYDVSISALNSILKVKSVVLAQHNSTWYCRIQSMYGSSDTLVFNLYIFAPPQTPYCLNATLLDYVNINLHCITEKVFPAANCVFYIKTNNTDVFESKNGSIFYQSEPSKTVDFIKTECSHTVSAGILGPGSHVLYVVMAPNITSNITEDMKRSSQYNVSVIMDYPHAALAPDCQVNDYIKENQNRTCTCYEKSQTFLPTQVAWTNGAMESGRLDFISKRPAVDNTTYTCSISNTMSWTNEIKYQPNISYGPDIAVLSIPNTTTDQCGNTGVNISGTCTVSDSNPDPTVYIYISNSPEMSQQKIARNVYSFSQIISESGFIYVLCRAVNPVFKEISTEIINSITVKGPPSIPQISSVSNQAKTRPTDGDQLQVSEGNTDIVCESKGGFPLYKNLTLVCGTNRISNENSDTISMSLNMSRGTQGMNCTCVVWHESKCQLNYVTVSLKLLKVEDDNVGAIIGGVIAAVVGVVLIAAVTVFIVRKHSNKLKRQSQETNAVKIQTYSNVQGREDYVNSDTHQYESPSFRPDHATQADTITPTNAREIGSNLSDNIFLGGFIVHNDQTNKGQVPEDRMDIRADNVQDEEIKVNEDEHHYEEINDVSVSSTDSDKKTEIRTEPEQKSSFVNV